MLQIFTMKLPDKFIKKYFNLAILLPLVLFIPGCKKLVEVNPPVTSLSSDNVYSTDATAIAAVGAIYTSLSSNGPFSFQLAGMSGVAGLSADELTLYSGTSDPNLQMYYKNALTASSLDFWTTTYPLVFKANAALQGLNSATALTPAVKQQLIGEVKFLRAFFYFYLVNLYGDVPLALSTDYTINNLLVRSPKARVWQQIIQDLHESEMLLSSNYLSSSLLNTTTERVRPTKWAAAAMVARAYLYMGNWSGADSAASSVIVNSLYRLNGLDTVFLKNSEEAIWQLQPVTKGINTLDGYAFILPASGPDGNNWVAYLNDSLVTHFETGDQRRAHWVDSVTTGGGEYFYAYKYKININDPASIKYPGDMSEYRMVLRLAEQYLIRSEARAQLDNLAPAKADLDSIRSRAGLSGTMASSKEDLLAAISNERRMELFTEWGHRWLDLKRTGTADAVMGIGGACAAKRGSWNTNSQLYPIPLSEIQTDPNLIQNPGYH